MWSLIKIGLARVFDDYKMSLIGLCIVTVAIGLLYLRYDHKAKVSSVVEKQLLVNENDELKTGNKTLVEQIATQSALEEVKEDVVTRNHQSHIETSRDVQMRVDRVYARPKDMSDSALATAQINGLWEAWCTTEQTTDKECKK